MDRASATRRTGLDRSTTNSRYYMAAASKPRLSVIVPVDNEARTVTQIVDRLRGIPLVLENGLHATHEWLLRQGEGGWLGLSDGFPGPPDCQPTSSDH